MHKLIYMDDGDAVCLNDVICTPIEDYRVVGWKEPDQFDPNGKIELVSDDELECPYEYKPTTVGAIFVTVQ